MSIGISMATRIENTDNVQALLDVLAVKHEAEITHFEASSKLTFCQLGDLWVRYESDGDTATMTADAATSISGAGFHHAVVTFMDDFIDHWPYPVEVEDETEYFDHRDFEKMKQEHFYHWLRQIVLLIERECKKGATSTRICWDLDQYVPSNIPGTVVTPFGRFDTSALCERVKREGIAPFAKEFFIWDNREKDACFYRNSALQIMWEDLRFVPADYDESEAENIQKAIDYLEKSVLLDSRIPFPKEEYLELCRLSEQKPAAISHLQNYSSSYPIGYRRDNITRELGKLSITIPGSFFYDDEDGTLLAYSMDENWRNLRLTSFTIESSNITFSDSAFKNSAEVPKLITAGAGQCQYAFMGEVREEEEIFYQTMAEVIYDSGLTLITLSYLQESDKAWAEAVIQSLSIKENKNPARIS